MQSRDITYQNINANGQFMFRQGVASFCNALKSLGELWKMNHEWMENIRSDEVGVMESINLEKLGMLQVPMKFTLHWQDILAVVFQLSIPVDDSVCLRIQSLNCFHFSLFFSCS